MNEQLFIGVALGAGLTALPLVVCLFLTRRDNEALLDRLMARSLPEFKAVTGQPPAPRKERPDTLMRDQAIAGPLPD